MDSQGFDPSIIVLIVLGVGFAALVIAVAVRMARKKPGVALSDSGRGSRTRDDDEDRFELVDEPKKGARQSPERAQARTPQPASSGKPRQPASPAPAPEPVRPSAGQVFKTEISKARHMSEGLARTRSEGFVARLSEAFKRTSAVDGNLIAGAEEALLTADMGVRTAMDLTEGLKNDFSPSGGPIGPQVMDYLKDRTYAMIKDQPHGMPPLDQPGLNVVMVVGVNGTGKTTNIAKLANWYRNQGRRVLLAAGDTFRAAGADQLGIWGDRIGIPVVVGRPGQDPSSLFFDAARKAVDEGFDIMIADTAGRLHTDVNLVEELKKVSRVLAKAVPGAPHQVLLMLDATMGQNAVRQADVFLKSVNVSGIGLSKLDGTAKGGVVISIARDMNLPIWFVGVGETVDDIRSFEPREFVEALFATG